MASNDLSNLHVCTEISLPADKIEEASARAVAENPANATPSQGFASDGKPDAILGDTGPPEIALPTAKLWLPGRTLRVRMIGGSNLVRSKVQQYALTWCQYANLVITFVDSGDAEIRISFNPGGSWSYVGTDCLTIPANSPTMNYGWFNDNTPDNEFSRVILHEFGHAVGCIHEMSSPAETIQWNKPAVYAYYLRTQGWNQAEVDRQIFSVYSAETTTFSRFDPQSIMLYSIPAELTTNGFSVGWNRVLSDLDKAFIGQVYPAPLYILHQGQNNNGSLWSLGTVNLQNWTNDTPVSNVGISYGPSAAWFQDKLYVLHEGSGDNHELWCNTFSNYQWTGDTKVPNVGTSCSPSVVVYKGKLYVFHQGTGNNGEMWYNVHDGNNWTGDKRVNNTGMSAGPGAVVFQDKLYVFHQGMSNNGWLWVNIFDGNSWSGDHQVPNTGISAGPSAVVYNGKIYCFHQGQSNNNQLWYNVFDGSKWAGDTVVSNTGIQDGPEAIVVGGNILVFHEGGKWLWYNTFNGSSWAGDKQAPNTGISYKPAVALRQ